VFIHPEELNTFKASQPLVCIYAPQTFLLELTCDSPKKTPRKIVIRNRNQDPSFWLFWNGDLQIYLVLLSLSAAYLYSFNACVIPNSLKKTTSLFV